MRNKDGMTSRPSLILKLAQMLDDQQLNSALCLIFNGMASMIAIVFIVLFIIGMTEPLLWLGIAGCFCMMVANTTDLYPVWLKKLAHKLERS